MHGAPLPPGAFLFQRTSNLHQMACGVYFCRGGCRLISWQTYTGDRGGVRGCSVGCVKTPCESPRNWRYAFVEKVRRVVQLVSYSRSSWMKHTSGCDLICPVTAVSLFFQQVTSIMFNFQHLLETWFNQSLVSDKEHHQILVLGACKCLFLYVKATQCSYLQNRFSDSLACYEDSGWSLVL